MRILLAIALLVPLSLSADVIDDLLRLPAPPPGELAMPRSVSEKARSLKPPPDDAPLPELVAWWSKAWSIRNPQLPSAAVRERLIEAIPQSIELIFPLLPPRADVCERVKRMDVEVEVEDWVLHNCVSERDALVAAAAKAVDAKDGGYVDQQEEVEALARVDWRRAEPVLRKLAGSPQPRTRTLAQALLYQHEPTEPLRSALQSTAADPAAPAFSRDRAIEALARTDWEDPDAWLLDRMSDRSLLELRDGDMGYAPFSNIVTADPEKWIPIMTGLLGHADATVRSNAANALGEFHLDKARTDALRPLIPWISDPAWAGDSGMNRLRLIQSVAGLELREAIPHLVRAVASDPADSNRAYAAQALAEFGDRSGNDAMRDALAAIESGNDRMIVAAAMIRTGALSAEELANGVETALALNKEPSEILDDPVSASPAAIIGFAVVRDVDDRDDVAALMLERAKQLEATKPELARKLIGVVETWAVATADKLLLSRIEQQQADARTIWTALQRRSDLRITSSDSLRRLRATSGIRAGVAAVLIGDAMDQQRVLAGDDLDAQRGLLAAARLMRDPLPVEGVAALFGRSPALDTAAEEWLIADDRAAARAVVQKRHPDEILILGSRLAWDPGHTTHDAFAEWEKGLLRRFRASRDDEWIVLGSAGTWSPMSTEVEIHIRGDKATVTADQRTVPLSRENLGALRLFLENERFDELGPFDTGTFDGIQYEYIHLTRSSGRRVFMNNPEGEGSPHAQLVQMLNDLAGNAVR